MKICHPSFAALKIWKVSLSVILFFLLSTTLSGCSAEIRPGAQRIVPPVNRSLPIYGTWKVDKCRDSDFKAMDKGAAKKWLGKKVEFSNNSVKFGSLYWGKAEFKIKRVASNDYFFYALRLQAIDAGVENRDIDIITVTSKNKFLYELIQLKPELLLVKYEDTFLYLVKESGKVTGSKDKTSSQNDKDNNRAPDEKDALKSGVLLGIKTTLGSDGNGLPRYKYETLWISAVDRKIRPVIQMNDILLPRKSGFWKLQVQRTDFGRGSEDIIKAYGIDGTSGTKLEKQVSPVDFWKGREGLLTKTLLYAGNDYICIELKGTGKENGSGKVWTEQYLQTRPVDHPENGGKGVKISDLCGYDGVTALENSKIRALGNSGIKPVLIPDKSSDTDNFSLYRKKGHWFFKGRLDFSEGYRKASTYYDINLIPPERLVFYDLLSVAWTNVKDRVPGAQDVFTSPNEDLAVVVENGRLLVYSIEQKGLSRTPMQKINLLPGDTVIMAEWATGNYVDNWQNVIATVVKANSGQAAAKP